MGKDVCILIISYNQRQKLAVQRETSKSYDMRKIKFQDLEQKHLGSVIKFSDLDIKMISAFSKPWLVYEIEMGKNGIPQIKIKQGKRRLKYSFTKYFLSKNCIRICVN